MLRQLMLQILYNLNYLLSDSPSSPRLSVSRSARSRVTAIRVPPPDGCTVRTEPCERTLPTRDHDVRTSGDEADETTCSRLHVCRRARLIVRACGSRSAGAPICSACGLRAGARVEARSQARLIGGEGRQLASSENECGKLAVAEVLLTLRHCNCGMTLRRSRATRRVTPLPHPPLP
jgi:hypothetical protein